MICRQGDTVPGTATATLERDSLILVVKGVPTQVCGNCGEEYIDVETTARLLETAEQVAKSGAQLHVREYIAA